MLVYWWEVSVVVSMNSPKVPLHISLLWTSDGRLADQTNDIVKKSLPPFPDGSFKFLVSYLVQLPQSFLYPFISRDKLYLTRLLASPRFAVAPVVDHACAVTLCQNSD